MVAARVSAILADGEWLRVRQDAAPRGRLGAAMLQSSIPLPPGAQRPQEEAK
jgi:hypothetical protein